MIQKSSFWIFVFLMVVFTSNAQKKKLVFATHWLPQAQFAGYYVAKDQGFYDAAGIDLEIIHPTTSTNVLEFLKNGSADIISLFLMTAMDARSKGTDLVNIAQFSEHSAILMVSKKKSGINKIEDFQGKKVGIWYSGFSEVPKALLKEKNIEVEWVPVLSSVNLFLMDGIDLMTVMWYNEYNQLYLTGLNEDELNRFFVSDFGYDIPEDGIYTLNSTLQASPDELSAFVSASKKGWEYAAAHPDYTVDLVVRLMREEKISANKPHQQLMLQRILQLQGFGSGTEKQTGLNKDDFDKAADVMRKSGNEMKAVSFGDFFKPVLLNK